MKISLGDIAVAVIVSAIGLPPVKVISGFRRLGHGAVMLALGIYDDTVAAR